jgi:hypothetical protein
MVRGFFPVVSTEKRNPTFELSGKIGSVGCYVHWLPRFAAQPLIQLVGSRGYIAPLPADGHTL